MADQTREAVDALVHALNHGRLQDILDAFTDDAVFSSDGGTAEGRVELAGMFDTAIGEPRPTLIPRSAERDGNVLDCRMTRRFTVSDGEQTFAHDVEIRCVFTVRDGAVSRVDVDPV